MTSYLPELLIAALGAVAIEQFYSAFAVKWPERYYDGSHGADPLVSRSSGRYLAFRSVPLFLTLVICGTAAERSGESRPIVVVALTIGYAVAGPGRAAAQAAIVRPFQLGVLLHRLATTAILGITLIAYLLVASHIDEYVPTAKEVINSALIALMIFVFTSLGTQLPKVRPDVAALVAQGRREIPERLLVRLNEADPGGLFEAIAIAENINRPKWVRQAERALVRRNGSYGIMQMRSRRPLSDDQSVEKFLEKYSKYGRGFWAEESVSKFVRKHNKTEEFFTLVDAIFWPQSDRGFRHNP